MDTARSSMAKVDLPQKNVGEVSGTVKCETTVASRLCIFDAMSKLKHSNDYDIGGTYSGGEPEFWFFCSTSVCHGLNHLLNLFVCHRKVGSFTIDIPESNLLIHRVHPLVDVPHIILNSNLSRFTFKSTKPKQYFFIKTYCLTDLNNYNHSSTLIVPIQIHVNPSFMLNQNLLKSIKLQHDLSQLLAKQEATDFTLESASHKTYPAHRVLLAAHSPVLRTMLKKTDMSTMFIDISDNDMALLLEYIYTGTIKDVMKQDCLKLLDIADKFELNQLFMLTQHIIGDQISVENAIEMASIAKKYKLEELQKKVFSYIACNPKVMETDAWNNLTDVELTKYLFRYTRSMNV